MRICTDEDLAEFYPIEETSKEYLEENLKENRFRCIDWKDEMILKGNFNSGFFSKLDFILVFLDHSDVR